MKLNPKFLLIFLGLVVIAFVFLLAFMVNQNKQCVEDPLVFGARVAYENTGEDLVCTCSLPGYPPVIITKEGAKSANPFINNYDIDLGGNFNGS